MLVRKGTPPSAIVLRAGTYFLKATLMLDARDSGLVIQNYPGEAAWLSGGVPLKTSWQRYKPALAGHTKYCRARCGTSGRDALHSATAGEPSCAAGCELAARTATADACADACRAATGKCKFTLDNYTINMCPRTASAAANASAKHCLFGCNVAFGEGM